MFKLTHCWIHLGQPVSSCAMMGMRRVIESFFRRYLTLCDAFFATESIVNRKFSTVSFSCSSNILHRSLLSREGKNFTWYITRNSPYATWPPTYPHFPKHTLNHDSSSGRENVRNELVVKSQLCVCRQIVCALTEILLALIFIAVITQSDVTWIPLQFAKNHRENFNIGPTKRFESLNIEPIALHEFLPRLEAAHFWLFVCFYPLRWNCKLVSHNSLWWEM